MYIFIYKIKQKINRLPLACQDRTSGPFLEGPLMRVRDDICPMRRQWKALKLDIKMQRREIQNRRRRYGRDSSESGHTQYANS